MTDLDWTPNLGVGSWPARRARANPSATAVIYQDRRYSYAEFLERVQRVAGAFHAHGVGIGDRIAYLGFNHPSFLETLFAVTSLGATFVALNPRLATAELAYLIEDSASTTLVYGPTHTKASQELLGSGRLATLISVEQDFEKLATESAPMAATAGIDLDSTAVILYTSGTTGKPKGAQLSHNNVTWQCVNVLVDVDIRATDVTLLNAPIFHVAALGMSCLPMFLKGGTIVLDGQFDPKRTLADIEKYHVTHGFGVPTMWERVAASPAFADTDLSSLRFIMCGGSPVPPALGQIYLGRGVRFSQGYGMTEATAGITLLDARDAEQKVGSAGKPHFFTDIKVVDLELDEVEPGQPGEILVHGQHVTSGYLGKPDATLSSFPHAGWFSTGDIAMLDEDGFAYIVDRAKDMIISGGENIYPAEIEKVLIEHPAVADCAIIGVPDETWGEVGAAIVVPTNQSPTCDELLEYLKTKLGKFKIPKSVEFVDQLPRNATGKLNKAVLRQQRAR
jgi:fatty-acyl-CoA synthase